MRTFAVPLIVISILGTITNLVWASPVLDLLFPVAVILLCLRERRPSSFLPVMILLGVSLLSAFIYQPAQLLEIPFYRRDGNMFVTWTGYVVAMASPFLRPERWVKYFILYVAVVATAAVAVYVKTGSVFGIVKEDGSFGFLFYATNAGGGFLATVSAFLLGQLRVAHRKLGWSVVLASLLAALFFTHSRGSLVGLAIGGIMMMYNGRGFRALVCISVVASILCAAIGFSVTGGGASFRGQEIQQSDAQEIESFGWLGRGGKAGNVALRVFDTWSSALSLFLRSPLVGTGFGSFDDRPYNLVGIHGVICINRPWYYEHTDSHAHNSYLHVMAEEGIVGLGLLLWLLFAIKKDIERIEDGAMRSGAYCALIVAIVAGASEHRLTTPSQMMPFVIFVGLAVGLGYSAKSESLSCGAGVYDPNGEFIKRPRPRLGPKAGRNFSLRLRASWRKQQ